MDKYSAYEHNPEGIVPGDTIYIKQEQNIYQFPIGLQKSHGPYYVHKMAGTEIITGLVTHEGIIESCYLYTDRFTKIQPPIKLEELPQSLKDMYYE
jgi:hypothetical protein